MWPRKLYLNYYSVFFLMAVLFVLGFCSIHMGGRPYINNKIKGKRKNIKLKNSDIGGGSVAHVVKKLVGISLCWTPPHVSRD